MFKLNNLTKKYHENEALSHVSLSIESGMNFIIGASGSGKSTLLKIMTGVDTDFDGSVYFYDKNIKELKQHEKNNFYNNVFGFIWQDFNLLEQSTVLENILLPTYLKEKSQLKKAKQFIRELKLGNVEHQQVKNLSGGQKQRVAIARELMKEPQVILADEPTSALDKESAQYIMEILREISKTKPVIIVTHDTSYITEEDTVFELDKGALISQKNAPKKQSEQSFTKRKKSYFSFKHILALTKNNFRRHTGRFLTSVLSLAVACFFLLTVTGNSVSNSSQSAFDEVFDMYGDSVLDISLFDAFTGGASTTENDQNNPNVDVNQDIGHLFDQFSKDDRVEFVSYLQPFDNISIQFNGQTYAINNSGNMPVINKLIAGTIATGKDNEVVVPESFTKKIGLSPDEALGKEITFQGEINEFNNNTPKTFPVKTKVKIVGVLDARLITNYEGQKDEYDIEDSFLFNQSALSDLLKSTNKNLNNLSFIIRPKTPADMIAIKNELNQTGIVPLGNFEVIEDLVKLNTQSTEQSSNATTILSILVIVMVLAIAVITTLLRKREYAIFKLNGFSNLHLRLLTIFETFIQALSAFVLLLLTSPILNQLSLKFFQVSIIHSSTIITCLLLALGVSTINFVVAEVIYDSTNIFNTLKTGEK
ncbi:ABC transporter ATP-binding protein/permease [Isobaculum melis]|uniref:ABC-type lipoprotein export system, ATPase component n=1 Tax=Isobaculum melis TaxID=142588 RepID=A0A1H9SFK7_9LACT|nr:ATP-binding cassette domain-containing protein [Isobaculum melis]SER83747.1 ABC-type lipoprotein export system, ATPase component [Isobaculum melis]